MPTALSYAQTTYSSSRREWRDSIASFESGALGWEWKEEGGGSRYRDEEGAGGADETEEERLAGGRRHQEENGRHIPSDSNWSSCLDASSSRSSSPSSIRTFRHTSTTSSDLPVSPSVYVSPAPGSYSPTSPTDSTFSTSTTFRFDDRPESYAASSSRASTTATSLYSDSGRTDIGSKRYAEGEEEEEDEEDGGDVLAALISAIDADLEISLAAPRYSSSGTGNTDYDSLPLPCPPPSSTAAPSADIPENPLSSTPFPTSPSSTLSADDPPPSTPTKRAKFASALKSFAKKSHEKPGFFTSPDVSSVIAIEAPSYVGGGGGRGGAGRKLAVQQVSSPPMSPAPSSSCLPLSPASSVVSFSASLRSSPISAFSGTDPSHPSHSTSHLSSSSAASIRTTSSSSTASGSATKSSHSSARSPRPAPIAYAGGRSGARASRKAAKQLIEPVFEEPAAIAASGADAGLSFGTGGGRGKAGIVVVKKKKEVLAEVKEGLEQGRREEGVLPGWPARRESLREWEVAAEDLYIVPPSSSYRLPQRGSASSFSPQTVTFSRSRRPRSASTVSTSTFSPSSFSYTLHSYTDASPAALESSRLALSPTSVVCAPSAGEVPSLDRGGRPFAIKISGEVEALAKDGSARAERREGSWIVGMDEVEGWRRWMKRLRGAVEVLQAAEGGCSGDVDVPSVL